MYIIYAYKCPITAKTINIVPIISSVAIPDKKIFDIGLELKSIIFFSMKLWKDESIEINENGQAHSFKVKSYTEKTTP